MFCFFLAETVPDVSDPVLWLSSSLFFSSVPSITFTSAVSTLVFRLVDPLPVQHKSVCLRPALPSMVITEPPPPVSH